MRELLLLLPAECAAPGQSPASVEGRTSSVVQSDSAGWRKRRAPAWPRQQAAPSTKLTKHGPSSGRVVGARSTERRHPDAQVGDGEAVQVPRPAARDLLGLRAQQRGEFALEAQ